MAVTGVTESRLDVAHPLDPLSAAEISRVGEILAGEHDLSAARFVEIVLLEPEKGALARFGASGERPPREAFVVLHDRVAQTACEAVVALDEGAVRSWREVPGVQAAITLDEYIECEQAVRADPRFREALARRGITNPELVLAEAWSIGGHAQSGEEGRRLAWTPCWFRDSLADNAYARPIEGLFTVVDLNTMEVLRVEDTVMCRCLRPPARTAPTRSAPCVRICARSRSCSRRGRASRSTVTRCAGRSGASASASPSARAWCCTRLRYHDQDRWRPVLHRASYAEMVIPYGDPSPARFRTNAFDIGEYGIGPMTNSLELGCDCLGEIRYFDAVCADSGGAPIVIPNAICMHEEDVGLLWKHYDWQAQDSEVRRSRRFVISSIITAANYEYALLLVPVPGRHHRDRGQADWDRADVGRRSGREAGLRPPGQSGAVGAEPPALLLCPDGHGRGRLHQHIHEVHTEAVPVGPENPYGNAFRAVARTCAESGRPSS